GVAHAEKYLHQALELHEKAGATDKIPRGDLADELAESIAGQGRAAEAVKWREQAALDYNSVLTTTDAKRAEVSRLITAFWKLQRLYQKTNQYRAALQLAEMQVEQPVGAALDAPRVKSEEGTLRVIGGSLARARKLLREAVAELQRQDPQNLTDLPRALNNLAIVEQATGGLDRAEELARESLKLHRQHDLPDDLILIESYNLL